MWIHIINHILHKEKKGSLTFLLSESNQLPELKCMGFSESQEQISSEGRKRVKKKKKKIWV